MTSIKQGNSSSGRINVGPDDDPHQFSFQNNAESPHAQASSPYFPKNTATPTLDSHPFTYPPDENFTQTFSGDEKKHHMKKKTANSVVIHIRLGAGLTKEIICDLDDDVLELAKNFCSENNLSLDAVPIIIKMIKQQFAAMLQRIRENTTKTEDHPVEEKKSSNPQSSRSMTKDSIQESQTAPKRVEVYEKPQTKPKLIGKLDVLVGPNDINELRLYQGQDPYEIAAIFCEDHHFPPQIVQALGKKLDDLKQAYESRKRTKESLHSSSNDTMNKEPELEGKTANFGGYIYPPEDNVQNQTSHFIQEPTEYRNPFTSKVNETDDTEPPMGSPNFNSRTLQKSDSISEHIPQDDIQYSDIPSRTDTESVNPQIQPQTYTQVQAPQVYAEVQVLPIHAQAQVQQQTQNTPVNPTKNPFESEAANSYERWNTLIKEKNIVRQVGSPVFGPASKDGGLNETRDKSPVNLKTTKIYKDAIAMFGDKLPNTKALGQIEEDSPTNKKKDSGKKITKGQVSALVDRLYYRELEKGAVVEEIRQKTRLKREKDEAKELTFHPKITRLERSPQDRYKDHIDRVHASEELKSKQIQDSFTFRPKISEASIQIAKNRARSRSPIYTQLYTEGFAQKSNNEKWREAMFKEKHPFSPRLPDDLDKFLKSRPKENQKEFTNRLVNEAVEKEERKFKARREDHNNDRDPVTGQKFHQPAISHDKYYQNLKKREEEEYSRERSRTPDTHQASTYTYSQEGLSYIEIELKDIFDKLDGDNDGFISSEKIDLSKLDADMLNAILEIIEILENSHSKFDFNAFNSAVNQLKLENKIRDAIRKANPATQNLNFFLEKTLESQDGTNKAINHEHPDYFSQRKKEKTFTKKSDSSTASSNQTDNSNMKLPKHYQGILEKKFLEKNP